MVGVHGLVRFVRWDLVCANLPGRKVHCDTFLAVRQCNGSNVVKNSHHYSWKAISL